MWQKLFQAPEIQGIFQTDSIAVLPIQERP